MSRPGSARPTQPVHVRFELYERIHAAAELKGVSAAWLVGQLLTEALEAMDPGPIRLTRRPELELEPKWGAEQERQLAESGGPFGPTGTI